MNILAEIYQQNDDEQFIKLTFQKYNTNNIPTIIEQFYIEELFIYGLPDNQNDNKLLKLPIDPPLLINKDNIEANIEIYFNLELKEKT